MFILNRIVIELERFEANNNAKLDSGTISIIVAQIKPTTPILTKDMIVKCHLLLKRNKAEKKQRRCVAGKQQNDLIL